MTKIQDTVSRELARDLEWLRAAEHGAVLFRLWQIDRPAVVIGRSVQPADEVNIEFCSNSDIPIVRRPSGGRSVLIGAATVQYTFALPYDFDPRLSSIAGTKALCNERMRNASSALATLDIDESGDLVRAGRKVAGVALKRTRDAVMLHGTILVAADLELIARALLHPTREPAYRCGRSHRDFLDNLGELDTPALERNVQNALAATSA